jgi:N-acetylneuraminic acid mutarotase
LGSVSPSNVPGAREWHTTQTDGNGNFWLFGGQGKDSTTNTYGLLNDLWQFNPNTKQWVWMSGSSTAFASGVYGQLGVQSASSVPGARDSTVSWIDASGNIWVFGGYGFDSNGTRNDLNDLWRYTP